ncbi:hypothetical protein DFJ58DRAFT_704923 [Suillus subalutaceus]|uniref:uncharacterized protein n=1 Tax=Suillus subalutaceus TaxID=48586 RepID=UPI001B86D80F|nr:uncharacterized protein DFJ58DRAFT_704923 [Suillus subalutaceus]KAG1848979.1 hypothetical protein DFJ58DRAFT_704923 [Suillus subalutaceus]
MLPTIFIIGGVSGMMFGGLHCLGWNVLFPRHAERILWRMASIGIACSSTLAALSLCLVAKYGSRWSFLWINIGIIGILYIFSRVTVIVLMFLSLRSLPPGAYDAVTWSRYIPHVTM